MAAMTSACVPATFGGLSLFGAEILSVNTNLVTNFSASVPSTSRFTQPSVELQNATFCNVTVSYTHPGQGDNVIVEAWLPANGWNGRFQAVGGGGWAAGRFEFSYANMRGALADGYATITTDSGLGSSQEAADWALLSPGNVNLYLLQNLASVTLEDEAIIGKSLIKSYYGRGPSFSYWNGCSQGGRQGLMLAQRYPEAYDGIAAVAPALYWTEFFPSMAWPLQFMRQLGAYPHGCEIEALTSAALSFCDGLDGVADGVVSEMEQCREKFDPFAQVGKTFNCSQENRTLEISSTAAAVANATWQGMRTAEGAQAWFGLSPGADVAFAAAATNCSTGTCVGVPVGIAVDWLSLFVAQDASTNLANLSHVEFDRLARLGVQLYKSVIGTDDPDLSAFKKAGGKLVTTHGYLDQLISHKGTARYHSEVSAAVPNAHGFYRHFEVPGLGHCAGGSSSEPTALFDQLRAWVENGTAPEHTPVDVKDLEGKVNKRILCPYPQKAVLDKACGSAAEARCWSCSPRS